MHVHLSSLLPDVSKEPLDPALSGNPTSDSSSLWQVPEGMLLTKERCTQLSRLRAQLEAADLPAWTVLALFLVDVDDQLRQGKDPQWGPYVRALPEASRCVLEWSPEEVCAAGSRGCVQTCAVYKPHAP